MGEGAPWGKGGSPHVTGMVSCLHPPPPHRGTGKQAVTPAASLPAASNTFIMIQGATPPLCSCVCPPPSHNPRTPFVTCTAPPLT